MTKVNLVADYEGKAYTSDMAIGKEGEKIVFIKR